MHSVHTYADRAVIWQKMSMHRPNLRKEPWYTLTLPSTESLVYLACWVPRTQNDVIRWIHPDRYPTNIRPVIRARRVLQQLGYLKATRDPHDLRTMKLLSMPEPFVLYAETQLATTRRPIKGKQNLSDDERSVLLKILDSNWFRQSFSRDLEIYSAGGALEGLAEFLEEICAMSEILAVYLGHIQPPMTTVLGCKSFDDFMKEWSAAKIESEPMIPKALGIIAKGLRRQLPGSKRVDLLIENTLDSSPFPPLCIPPSLAHKLSTIGRVPLTLALSFAKALKEERELLAYLKYANSPASMV